MTSVTRIFDFPYNQLEKHTSIPDAFVTKKNSVWEKTATEEFI
jgi:long-chain acyl-CoA synthetase